MNYVKSYYKLTSPKEQSYYIYTNSEKISDPINIQYHFQKFVTCMILKLIFTH